MRIRGVKTNIQFLINVLNHETFQSGKMLHNIYRRNTGAFYDLQKVQDRATKILEFIGDKIVNPQNGDKPDLDPHRMPVFDTEKKIWGSRDEFLKLGAEKDSPRKF